MYEKQCSMHTLYDCFVNECDPCVLFVLYRFLQLSSQILPPIRGASLRQTTLSFDTFTFDARVFWLNFNVGLNMFFVSYAIRKIYI